MISHMEDGLVPNRLPDDGKARRVPRRRRHARGSSKPRGSTPSRRGRRSVLAGRAVPARSSTLSKRLDEGTRHNIHITDEGLFAAADRGLRAHLDGRQGRRLGRDAARAGFPVELQALWARACDTLAIARDAPSGRPSSPIRAARRARARAFRVSPSVLVREHRLPVRRRLRVRRRSGVGRRGDPPQRGHRARRRAAALRRPAGRRRSSPSPSAICSPPPAFARWRRSAHGYRVATAAASKSATRPTTRARSGRSSSASTCAPPSGRDPTMPRVRKASSGSSRSRGRQRARARPSARIADADPPHRPGGCVAQAWSVAELLRALALGSCLSGKPVRKLMLDEAETRCAPHPRRRAARLPPHRAPLGRAGHRAHRAPHRGGDAAPRSWARRGSTS